jgi:hypothetical protein
MVSNSIIIVVFQRGSTGKNGNNTETSVLLPKKGKRPGWEKVRPVAQDKGGSDNQQKDFYELHYGKQYMIDTKTWGNGKVRRDACFLTLTTQKLDLKDLRKLGLK